jgi:DMSO/TMAO reductase YedYZ molybdopterin-dependent catalytic subunit
MALGSSCSGALAGLLGAGVALGTGELAAAAVRPEAAPVAAVADAAVDLAPAPLKDFAIRTFGSHDKPVLLAGIVVVLALLAAAAGRAAVRRPLVGHAAVGVLGAVGLAAALTRPGVRPLDGVPSVLAAVAAWTTLYLLLWREPLPAAGTAGPGGTGTGPDGAAAADGTSGTGGTEAAGRLAPAPVPPADADPPRRRFLLTGAAAAGVAAVSGLGGRALQRVRFSAAESRAAVRIPPPASSVPRLPAARQVTVPGVSPFYTPNRDFYRVDTAIVVPQVPAETWSLRVHGMVDRPLVLRYDQLLARRLVERDVTLTCVSNEVGDPYVGNARWVGAHLAELLEEAGLRPGADQLVCRSADGMTIGTPAAAVTDGRDAMLAVAMNDEPLPVEHGFPVRMVVPGLYGYVSACKWIVDIEVTTFDAFDAYWVRRGWARMGPIRTESRIDTPASGTALRAGRVPVAGVAWAQHRGIDRVEVQVDDGDWQECRLGGVPSLDTWRQWAYDWQATPGRHRLRVRATDGTGRTQTGREQDAYPSGATGWHTVHVTVR